jgi:hypothetical protein
MGRARSNMSIDTDVLSAGFALLSAGFARLPAAGHFQR